MASGTSVKQHGCPTGTRRSELCLSAGAGTIAGAMSMAGTDELERAIPVVEVRAMSRHLSTLCCLPAQGAGDGVGDSRRWQRNQLGRPSHRLWLRLRPRGPGVGWSAIPAWRPALGARRPTSLSRLAPPRGKRACADAPVARFWTQSRFYFAVLSAPEQLRHSALAAASVCFSVDNELVRPPGTAAGPGAAARLGCARPAAPGDLTAARLPTLLPPPVRARCMSPSSPTLAPSTWLAATASASRRWRP